MAVVSQICFKDRMLEKLKQVNKLLLGPIFCISANQVKVRSAGHSSVKDSNSNCVTELEKALSCH